MALTGSSQLVNPELVEERARRSFRAIELTNILDDGPAGTERRHETEKLLIESEMLTSYREFISLSLDDYYSKSVKIRSVAPPKYKDIIPTIQALGGLDNVFSGGHLGSIASPAGDPLIVHGFMFVPTILHQATEEQKARWLPLIRNNTILGTFCMTELGHGTNIRGLETTATYDPKTEEFILHSPTLTSIKCWPGGMGRTCNSAVVFAQLYSKGQCHGLHAFFVQLRNYEDHRVLPGVQLGEIGPKMGVNTLDNGFAKFEQFRIPRDNMLMKYAKLLPDGTYIKPDLVFASTKTLQLARTVVIINSLTRLAQAVTIAVRYNAVRRQGHLEPGESLEVKILDYKTQQYKLFPRVAMVYAGMMAYKKAFRLYEDLEENYSDKKAGELHVLLAGMKGTCAEMSFIGIDQCRQACGGSGYLQASYLPFLSSLVAAFCILDGENTVLLLQTARYLLKENRAIQGGKCDLSPFVAYLRVQSDINRTPICTAEDDLLLLFQRTTARLVSLVTQRMEKAVAGGKSLGQAWNDNTLDLVKCSRFHIQVFIIEAANNYLLEHSMSQPVRAVLQRLFDLLALYWIRESAGDFMQHGCVSAAAMEKFSTRLFDLFDELRPEMVTLVDAFDLRDEALHSVIGCYDGRVYERMLDYMTKLPSNQIDVHPVFEKYMKPLQQNSKL